MAKEEDVVFNIYLAVAYAEGLGQGDGATQRQQIRAWAYIIKHDLAKGLQDWFGRTCNTLIQQGFVDKEGNISWKQLDDKEGNAYDDDESLIK